MGTAASSRSLLDIPSVEEGGWTGQELRVVVPAVAPGLNPRAAAALLALLQRVARKRVGDEKERRVA